MEGFIQRILDGEDPATVIDEVYGKPYYIALIAACRALQADRVKTTEALARYANQLVRIQADLDGLEEIHAR